MKLPPDWKAMLQDIAKLQHNKRQNLIRNSPGGYILRRVQSHHDLLSIIFTPRWV